MHVIVGVTGGIAAYKATTLIRLFTEAGHTVKVIPTQNALRFIGATTLEALSHNTVDPDLYTDVDTVKHIELAKSADLIVIAPATASFLARYANGLADDLLSNVLLATLAPVVVAPAMHTEMWNHDSVKENISILTARGVHILEPAIGRLTGQDSGPGRLPEPQEIFEYCMQQFPANSLKGIKFLVTAGGTQEPIDDVRFLGNRSSGKQGIEIALAAKKRGAEVTLIAANVAELPSSLDRVLLANTAAEMKILLESEIDETDCLVMAAAVSDYRAEKITSGKIKKSNTGEKLSLDLVQNPDLLAEAVSRIKSSGRKTLTVGFAAEACDSPKSLEELAIKKLATKGCDLIVANNVAGGQVFNSDDNQALIIGGKGQVFSVGGSKRLVANEIIDIISDMLS